MSDPHSSPLMNAYFTRRNALTRFLAARTGSRDEADDVLQELYLKIGRAHVTEDVRDPAAYLFRMAANLVRDRRRQQVRARTRDMQWIETQHVVVGSQAIDDAPSQEAAHAARQRLHAIRAAIEQLSPQCRRVFTLHKFEGLSHEQVARELGITRSTVEKHMHTALRHLLAELGDDKT